MRRLMVVALLLAGLCAPPAVLAQVGGAPGITSPVSLSNTAFTGTTAFGLGTCVSTSAIFGPLSGLTTSIKFSGKSDGLCYDTGADANSEGMAFVHGGRMYGKIMLNGGFTLFGSSVGGLGGGKVLSTSATGGTLWGPDAANATPYTASSVAAWSYTTAQTPPGQFALARDSGITFQGSVNDANLTVLYVTNPTAARTVTLPDFSGTVLVSSTANEPDTGNAVWANTGSFIFEGSTANGFETELDTVDPSEDRTIFLPDANGEVLVVQPSASANGQIAVSGTYTGVFTAAANQFQYAVLNSAGTTSGQVDVAPTSATLAGSDGTLSSSVGAFGPGILITTTGAKPACDAGTRGHIWRAEGGGGVADTVEICGKSAADAYSWVALATF